MTLKGTTVECLVPIDREQNNIVELEKHFKVFLGLSELAAKLGNGNFGLKLFRLFRTANGKAKNYHIITQQQWEMGFPLLLSEESQKELNGE